MKLTKKGLLKIVGDIVVNSPEHPLSETLENWNRARDFDQDDFEGVVCLSVEEAKGILWDLRDLYKQTYGYEWVKNEPWFDEFKNRIEQAEGKL